MEINIQMLLSLFCMVVADEQFTSTLHFDETDHKDSLKPKEPVDDNQNQNLVPLNIAKNRELVDEVPENDDVYSYNIKRTYDRVETYREHMDLFKKRNLQNPPNRVFDTLSADDKLNNPGNILNNEFANGNDNYKYTITKFNENNNKSKKPQLMHLTFDKNLENKKEEQDSPSKIEEEDILTLRKADTDRDTLRVNSAKNYHPEYRRENNEYQNIANDPRERSNNDLQRNVVVHINIVTDAYDPQQNKFNQIANTSPANTVHISIDTSVPNSDVKINNQQRGNSEQPKFYKHNTEENDQKPMSTNIPIRANKPNLQFPTVQSNPMNNYSTSSVLLYINGQLILVPGITINPNPLPIPIQNYDKGEDNKSVQNPSNTFNHKLNQNFIQRFNSLASVPNDDSENGVQSENSHSGSDTGASNDSRIYFKPIPPNH